MDPEDFRKFGKEAIDMIADYHQSVRMTSPQSSATPGYLFEQIPHSMPEHPEPYTTVVSDMLSKVKPGLVDWQSGNFFGWFPNNSSLPSLLGEMFSLMYGVSGFNWECAPALTELELIVMDWMCDLLGLGKQFKSINNSRGGGVIQGGSSNSILTAMLAAREKMLHKISMQENIGLSQANECLSKLVVYASDQTHLAVEKAAKIIGVKIRILPSDVDYKLTETVVQEAVAKDRAEKLFPFFVCGTFGTTNTTAIDDLPGLANVAEAEDLWLHVDAAYAGASLACPEFRDLAQGIERAQSISFSTNKWMLTHFGCSPLWVAESAYLVKALQATHAYVAQNEMYSGGAKSDMKPVRNMRDWQTQLTRPFLALRVWFVLRMYGATGIRANIRTKVELAQWLDKKLREDGRFEVIAPVVFGLVVFRVRPESLNHCLQSDANQATLLLLKRIQTDGQVFITGTQVKGRSVIRVAIGSTYVQQENIRILFQAIVQAAASIGLFSN